MKKETVTEMNELSIQVFGKPYAWKKLLTKGLVMGNSINPKTGDRGIVRRRRPLTVEGAKHYMETTLKMLKAKEDSKDDV